MVIDMITIRYESGDVRGKCTYRIQVNRQLVCKFEHDPSEGTAECLQKAADALMLNEWVEWELLNDIKGG